VGALLIYNVCGWNNLYELIRILLIEYLGVQVLALIFGLGRRLFGRRQSPPAEIQAQNAV